MVPLVRRVLSVCLEGVVLALFAIGLARVVIEAAVSAQIFGF